MRNKQRRILVPQRKKSRPTKFFLSTYLLICRPINFWKMTFWEFPKCQYGQKNRILRPFLTVDKNLRQKHDFGPKPTSKIRPILTVRQKFGQKKWIRTYVRSTWTMKGTLKPNRWSDWSVHDREAQNEMTTIKSNIPWSKFFILYWACVLFFKETVMLDQLQGRTFIFFFWKHRPRGVVRLTDCHHFETEFKFWNWSVDSP